MYQDHFGLVAEPFSIAPDPAFLFLSEAHNEALAHLMYGFSHGGFVLITGEVGTGKTTLLRNLLHRTPPDLDVAFILNPRLTVRELLETLCDELGVHYGNEPLESVKLYIDALNKHLLKTHESGRSTVMVIDEAQNLSPAVLEQVRLLTNLETNDKKLLRIILVGQPELAQMLERTELRQLAQRITARYHLTPLSREDVHAYVGHRLARAGGNPGIFSPRSLDLLYKLSKGTPRLINVIADRAMLGAYVEGVYQVTPKLIRKGAQEVLGKPQQASAWGTNTIAIATLVAILVVAVSGIAWYLLENTDTFVRPSDFVQQNSPAASTSSTNRLSENTSPQPANNAQPNRAPAESSPQLSAQTPGQLSAPTTSQVSDNLQDANEAAVNARPSANTNNPEPELTTQDSIANPVQNVVINPTAEDIARPSGGTFTNQRRAYRAVFNQWGADYPVDSGQIPCDFAPSVGLQCLSKNGGWREISALNIPVVLELWDEQSTPYYAALLAASGDNYSVNLGGQLVQVTPKILRDSWFGQYVVLWQTPPDYHGSLRQGDEHPSVAWLRERLGDLLPSQDVGRPGKFFDQALHTAVVVFQSEEGLIADGIVGPLTWIHLGDRLNLPTPKLAQ